MSSARLPRPRIPIGGPPDLVRHALADLHGAHGRDAFRLKH
jgi:hypothetical protein